MLKTFLKDSVLAEKLFVRTDLVLSRKHFSPEKLDKALASGELSFPGKGRKNVLLETNGMPVARGRIIRRWGRYYFKVQEIHKG